MPSVLIFFDAGQESVERWLKDRLEQRLVDAGVSPDMRRMVMYIVENTHEYIALCREHRRRPDDPATMRYFLAKKGLLQFKLGDDDMVCGAAIAEFVVNVVKNKATLGAVPYGQLIVGAMTLLDMLAIGNSCTFVQEAYHRWTAEYKTNVVSPPRRTVANAEFPWSTSLSLPAHERLRCEAELADHRRLQRDAVQRLLGPGL